MSRKSPHQSPRQLAKLVCSEAKDLCVEGVEAGEEELKALVGIELAVMETYSHISRILGLNAIAECLGDDECLEQLVDTAREATTLYIEDKYFFDIDMDEIKRIAEYLRRQLDSHDGAPPAMQEKRETRPSAM